MFRDDPTIQGITREKYLRGVEDLSVMNNSATKAVDRPLNTSNINDYINSLNNPTPSAPVRRCEGMDMSEFDVKVKPGKPTPEQDRLRVLAERVCSPCVFIKICEESIIEERTPGYMRGGVYADSRKRLVSLLNKLASKV